MITFEELVFIYPFTPKTKLAKCYDPLCDAMEEFEIDNPYRIAFFLAQVGHESAGFRYFEELASGSAYDRRSDLGNTHPEAVRIATKNGSTPGKWWKGHGPIQITGYFNHRECGKALELDLLNAPTLIATPENGFRSAGWFWDTNNLNELADDGNFVLVTKRINGGLNGFKDRKDYLARAEEVLL